MGHRISSWTDSQMSDRNRLAHCEKMLPPLLQTLPLVGHELVVESGQLSSSGWDRKEKNRGGEQWVLTRVPIWIVSQRLAETMDTDGSCGNTPIDRFVHVWKREREGDWNGDGERSDLAAETRWRTLQKESVEQSMEQEEPWICVTTHRKCSVMLRGCVREGVGNSGAGEDETKACSSLQRIYPITPYE